MELRQVAELLNARVLTNPELLDTRVDNVFCTDVMADVLAYASDRTVLITRLLNLSVVRSAMMADIHCVVFSDSTAPAPEILDLAEIHDMVVMSTHDTMFHAVSVLLDAGLLDAEWE